MYQIVLPHMLCKRQTVTQTDRSLESSIPQLERWTFSAPVVPHREPSDQRRKHRLGSRQKCKLLAPPRPPESETQGVGPSKLILTSLPGKFYYVRTLILWTSSSLAAQISDQNLPRSKIRFQKAALDSLGFIPLLQMPARRRSVLH